MPDVGALLKSTLDDFMKDIGPYAMAGLGYMLVMVPVMMVGLITFYAGLFAVIFASAAGAQASGSADAGAAVSGLVMAGVGLGMVVLIAVLNMAFSLAHGSLLRAIHRHQRGEETLGIKAPFSTLGTRAGSTIAASLLAGLLTFGGFLLCVFPGFVVALLLFFTMPLVAIHGLTAGAAVRQSIAVVRSNLGYHLILMLAIMVVGMIASYVPVVGPMFIVAMTVRVYREIFGDGEVPVMPR
jgi:uncharacterized membrane protein